MRGEGCGGGWREVWDDVVEGNGDRRGVRSVPARRSSGLGDRDCGMGADQGLVVEAPTAGTDADFRMDIYNADGSRVEMCANGIRAFYTYQIGRAHV